MSMGRESILLFPLLLTAVIRCDDIIAVNEDAGRALVLWNGGTIKFIVGWSIPVPNHTPFVTLFLHSLQMAYPTISNATMLTDLLQQGLAKGVRYTKRSVYYFLDRFLSRYGSLNRQCLSRIICELSQMSVGHSSSGELLQYIFKPEEEGKYRTAWQRGMTNEDCEEFYYCPYAQSLLSQFTTVQYL